MLSGLLGRTEKGGKTVAKFNGTVEYSVLVQQAIHCRFLLATLDIQIKLCVPLRCLFLGSLWGVDVYGHERRKRRGREAGAATIWFI
jgi:hypothetical protein